MAECTICGISYGMLGGGPEQFTGEKLLVCSTCGQELKEMNQAYNNGNTAECRNRLQKIMYKTKNPEANAALVKYGQRIMQADIEAEKARSRDEERRRQQEELLKRNRIQYKKNAHYEYCVETVMDSKISGAFNKEDVQALLTSYASDGWRLHSAFSNELGKNTAAALGFGVNATVEETILIFERCIKAEER